VNLELFIARRIAHNGSGNRPGVMVRIAVVAVALSVTVMILALAVIMGFKREITDRVTGFSAQVEVADLRSAGSIESVPVLRSEQLERTIRSAGEVVRLTPYAVKGGVVKTPDAILGVMLKGVDGGYEWSFFRDHLLEGELPRVGDSIRTKEILISRSVAREMGLVPGDKVEMLFVESEKSPRRDRFKVSGIYATGMDEFDRSVAMTDLRNVQRLADWSSEEVSGYEVTLADFLQAEDFSRRLNDMLLDSDREAFWDLTARSAQERFLTVFDWLKTHDVNAAVILVIMVVVAVFNMATALLTLVLERTRMIGLLKTMGMNNASLRRIFLYRALMLILRGVVWGNAIGLGICLLQYYFHLIPLDPEGYMLSEVPVAFGVGWWLALNAGVVAVILTLLMLPASIISQVKPVEAIRYDS
jgi:lipoprotein-releasing system permease protein